MPLRNLVIIVVAAVISLTCYYKAERDQYVSTINEALHIISQNYVEEVEPRKLFEGAMDGMVQKLDPYSNYISPDDFRQFQESLDQEFGGIGIVVELNPESKRLTVMTPLVNTPAYEAGLRAGDVILRIDGRDTQDMSLKDAVGVMRGKPGTPVRLLIGHIGEEEPVEYTVNRAIIPIESVMGDTHAADGSWNYFLENHPRISYIRVTTFGEHTVDELRKALTPLNGKTDALILDLRNNAGGLLGAAVETCDMFIDDSHYGGRIVSTIGRDGVTKSEYPASDATAIDRQIPMVVLVNRFSASASEIVAACLQDHQRAVVIGERTWGKGSVQNVIHLEQGRSALKLTTATYWRPSGQNIHRKKDAPETEQWGVRPDEGFEVKLTDEEFEQVFTARRRRDVIRSNVTAPADVVDAEDEAEPTDPAVVDPQLRRAVEYLEQKIGSATSSAKA